MNTILKKINKINGVRGSLIVNRDGMILVSDVTEGIEEGGIAALSSTIYANLEGALSRLKLGAPRRFAITGERGRILLFSIAGDLIMAVITRKDVNMGLLKVDLKDAADELAKKLGK
ncbi:MAG: roadblock/LC7 domain-containing protein [Planctomycetota bacterium]